MATKPRKKINKQRVQIEEVAEEKKPSLIQKLFFWVIIPLLFVLAVLLIAAEVTGTNVFEKAKEFGGSSQQSAKEVNKVNSYNEKQIADIKAQLQEKEAEIAKVQGQVEDAKSEASKAKIEKHRLEVQINKLEQAKDETKVNYSDIVNTYEKMAPKSAAPIITTMQDADALKILSSLKPDTLAAILEKMPSDKAAHYTELLSKK